MRTLWWPPDSCRTHNTTAQQHHHGLHEHLERLVLQVSTVELLVLVRQDPRTAFSFGVGVGVGVGVGEVDLRAMLEQAAGFQPSAVEGRFIAMRQT